MRISLDAPGVTELTQRFGDFHDAVVRGFSGAFGPNGHLDVALEAQALDGSWWRVVLHVEAIWDMRITEGVAIWANERTSPVSTIHPDGHVTHDDRPRDFSNLAMGGPTNHVIFAAAIHVVAEGVFVDLAAPTHDAGPAEWRESSFYVFGRRGEAILEVLP